MQIKLFKDKAMALAIFVSLTAVGPILSANENTKSCHPLFPNLTSTPGINLIATSEGLRSYSHFSKISKNGKYLVTIGFGGGQYSPSRLTIQNIQTGRIVTQSVQSIETFDITNTQVIVKYMKGRKIDSYDLEEPNRKSSYNLPLKKGEAFKGSSVTEIKSQIDLGFIGVNLGGTLFVQNLHKNLNMIRLEDVKDFEWHPTLPVLAYTVNVGQQVQLRILNLGTQSSKDIVSGSSLDLGRFSPNGKMITYFNDYSQSRGLGIIEFLENDQLKIIDGDLKSFDEYLSHHLTSSKELSINWISSNSFIIQPQRSTRFIQVDVSGGRMDPITFNGPAVSRTRDKRSVRVGPGVMAMLTTNDKPIYVFYHNPSKAVDAELYFYVGEQTKHFSINKLLRQLMDLTNHSEEERAMLKDSLSILETYGLSSISVLGARDRQHVIIEIGKATLSIDLDKVSP